MRCASFRLSLFRRDWRTGQRTSHTFILYLEGAAEEGGGETVLLESLSGGPLAEARASGELMDRSVSRWSG